MWKCLKCGNVNSGEFCLNCGEPCLDITYFICQECGAKISSKKVFCTKCGTKLALNKECLKNEKDNVDDAQDQIQDILENAADSSAPIKTKKKKKGLIISLSAVAMAAIAIFVVIIMFSTKSGVYYPFVDSTGSYGYVNEHGKTVIEPQFDDAYKFHENAARVKVDDKWAYINKKGELLVEPQFDEAYDYSNGLARVKVNGRY